MRLITHHEMTKLAAVGEYVEITRDEALQRIAEKQPVWGTAFYHMGYASYNTGSPWRHQASIWENGKHNHTDSAGRRAPDGQLGCYLMEHHYWKQAENK